MVCSLSVPVETPAEGRGGCGRMTVSPTGRLAGRRKLGLLFVGLFLFVALPVSDRPRTHARTHNPTVTQPSTLPATPPTPTPKPSAAIPIAECWRQLSPWFCCCGTAFHRLFAVHRGTAGLQVLDNAPQSCGVVYSFANCIGMSQGVLSPWLTTVILAADGGGGGGGDGSGSGSCRRDCHSAAPPLPLVGVSIWMERDRPQNDSLANG